MTGSVTTAALRHRPRQAALVVALSAVVTAAAALGPLYARAVEQSILRQVLSDAPADERGIVVSAAGNRPASPDELARAATRGDPLTAFGDPIGGADVPVVVGRGERLATGALASRDDLCAHLRLASGRCPAAAGEVAVSARDARSLGLRPGDHLTLREASGSPGRVRATVVGSYPPYDVASDYWFDRSPSTTSRPSTVDRALALDTVFASWETLAGARWRELRTHVDLPLRLDQVDLDQVDAVQAAAREVDRRVRTVGGSAATGLGPLLATTGDQRAQARTVVPLLAVQLALLGVVVLGFVCAAATEQRRPEVALARLRGQGAGGAAGMLVRELGTLILLGVAAGAALGWGVTRAACLLWLAPGVGPELRWPVPVAVTAAGTAGMLAVAATGAPTLRLPLVNLLRKVPPRGSPLRVGMVEGGLVAAAGAGFVTMWSGRAGGPVALLAPSLLAVAGGLLLAQAVVPVANRLARLSLRRGRLPTALAGTHVARRPALRRLIAIITVACALMVFAVDTWTVAGRNRQARAEVGAGAPVVLTVTARDAASLLSAVLGADPDGRFATPVVTTSSATEEGPRTTAVVPDSFARIARWGSDHGRPGRPELAAITPDPIRPVRLLGDTVEVDAGFQVSLVSDQPGQEPPRLRPLELVLHVVDPDGRVRAVGLGRLRRGDATYRTGLRCPAGCSLHRIEIARQFGDLAGADVRLRLHGVRAGGPGQLRSVELDPTSAGAWQPAPARTTFPAAAAVSAHPPLTITGTSFSESLIAQRGDVPALPRVLVAGDVQQPSYDPPGLKARVVAPGLKAFDEVYEVGGRVPRVPRTGGRGVLVDLRAVAAVAGPPSGQTTYAVWLAADDPPRERHLVSALSGRGVAVTRRDTVNAHAVALAREGPTLALRLALLAGLVSVVLAVAVLVVGVATSGTTRARDLAALRLVGVPARVLRAAAVREQLAVAVLGVLAGAGLGLAAAQAALPRVPLSGAGGADLPVVLDPAWPAVAATAAACLLMLGAVSVAVGRALAAAGVPSQVREGA